MSVRQYISGNIRNKADFFVTYIPHNSGKIKTQIHSKTSVLHGSKLQDVCKTALSDLHINHGQLKVIDNGGQYFVLQARIESAVKSAHPKLDRESLGDFKKHAQYKSDRERFRRSRLYLPGNQAKLMLNAGIHQPDAIILDLEDSVVRSEKDSARLIVRNALRHLNFFGAERMVRINQGGTGLKDLEAVIPHNVHLILVPKVEEESQLTEVEEKIQSVCKNCNRKEPVYLMPILESATGILNSLEIAKASKNNVAIAIGLEDYTADIGVERTNKGRESLFARSQVVNAARSAGIQAIDTVFSDVNDEDALRESVREAKELQEGINKLKDIKAEIKSIKAHPASQYNPGWNLAIDLNNMIIICEAVARAALKRQESRGAHTRLDYPEEKEEGLTFNSIIKKAEDGSMSTHKEQRETPPEQLSKIAYAELEELENA